MPDTLLVDGEAGRRYAIACFLPMEHSIEMLESGELECPPIALGA